MTTLGAVREDDSGARLGEGRRDKGLGAVEDDGLRSGENSGAEKALLVVLPLDAQEATARVCGAPTGES